MASPGVNIETARATEKRYQNSFRKVMLDYLGTTPEGAAWCEAELEALWKYGELTPYEAALDAMERGDRELYEHARLEACRLHDLAVAAEAAEEAE